MLNFADEFRRKDQYPETLLDIGCGPCPEGEPLLEHGILLTGVDQDEETIREVRKRLPGGKFVAADAAVWMAGTVCRYDAVLIRRPDVIFRSESWHAVFRRIPSVLKPGGSAIVTTPGRREAGICAEWLRETAGKVRLSETAELEEAFCVRADDFRETEEKDRDTNRLIQELSWEDGRPQMVCDLRTGLCTMMKEEEITNEDKYTEKESR